MVCPNLFIEICSKPVSKGNNYYEISQGSEGVKSIILRVLKHKILNRRSAANIVEKNFVCVAKVK